MRAFKFRFWDKETKKYCKVFPSRHKTYFFLNSARLKGDKVEFDETVFSLQTNEHLVIEQFTGLKDINGKEIYEGDIVITESSKTPCAFCDLYGEYDLFVCKHEILVVTLSSRGVVGDGISVKEAKCNCENSRIKIHNRLLFNESVKVIGNIHENPELVE